MKKAYNENALILKLVYMILDIENCILPVCKTVEETSPMETAREVHDYLSNILEYKIGDPIQADKLLEYACFMSKEELLKEIEKIKS